VLKIRNSNYTIQRPPSVRVEGSATKFKSINDVEFIIQINVDAKNSYDGYTGAKPVYCYLT
jgi:hypothetical protein